MKERAQELFKKKIKSRIGEDATDQQIADFLKGLSAEEMFNLILDIPLEDNAQEKPDFCLPDDEDDDEEWNNDSYADDLFIFQGNGRLECMPAKEIKKYTIRIKLRRISPSIWRKIEVPSSVKLTSLAEIILTAMGWENTHLHQFYVKGSRGFRGTIYSTAKMDGDEYFAWETKSYWGGDYSIGHLLEAVKDKVLFEYDFGDSWEHEVVLSKVEDYADSEQPRVRLLDGKRACPPEDCGGVWGYSDLCEAMQHPRSARAREFKDWLGYKYNPEKFCLEDAQKDIDNFNK